MIRQVNLIQLDESRPQLLEGIREYTYQILLPPRLRAGIPGGTPARLSPLP